MSQDGSDSASQAGTSKESVMMGMRRALKELAAFSYRGVADALQEALQNISVCPSGKLHALQRSCHYA